MSPAVKAERPEEADYVARRTLPDIELCKERGFAVSLGEWRREIFGVAAPLYRTASGDCLSVNCGIPSFRFSAEQIERECGPRILGLARSIRSLVEDEQRRRTIAPTAHAHARGVPIMGGGTCAGEAALTICRRHCRGAARQRAGARAADNWPSRPIHIIVPYPAGGIVDIVARAVTEQVGRDTEQAIVVEGAARRQQQYRHRRRSRAAKATATPGWSRDPRCWSIRRSTRTPAGMR